MDETPLTAEDYASIDLAAEQLDRMGWMRRFSLEEVMDHWASFVSEVENGYRMTIDDYTNDLSIRDWPELARPMLTERAVRSMEQRLAPLDSRFREATAPIANPIPGATGDKWRARRLPKLLVDEFAEDVARIGLATHRARQVAQVPSRDPIQFEDQTDCDWCYGQLDDESRQRSRGLGLDVELSWACSNCLDLGRVTDPPDGWEGDPATWPGRSRQNDPSAS